MRCNYYDKWVGPVNDIPYQIKLIGLRGNLPDYDCYKPARLQRTDTAVSYVYQTPSTTKRLV